MKTFKSFKTHLSFMNNKLLKILVLFIVLNTEYLINNNELKAQRVGINATGAPPDTSAMLDVVSTDKGILIPRMTQTQRNAIALPATSLSIYQTDTLPGFYYYSGIVWLPLLSAGVPSGAVMAFNAVNCPPGWSEFTQARGRTVIGSGTGPGLTPRALLDTAGEKMHTLTISELASHRHDLDQQHAVIYGSGSLGSSHMGGTGMFSKYEGGDQPHNNMQPFVTLLYCVKN